MNGEIPSFERNQKFISEITNIILKSIFIRAPDIFISGMPDMKIPSLFLFYKKYGILLKYWDTFQLK